MYSREETQKLKREFWIAFAEKYPRKWLLYDTKIKDFSFKFYVDNRKAQVLIDIEPRSEQKRLVYFEKLEALKSILHDEFLPDAIFESSYFLDNGKVISRVWVEKLDITVSNRNDWNAIFDFFNEKMAKFELFFFEYGDFIKDVEVS